jgi:transcriptional regulator with XRE-family HTH domain
VNAIKRHRRKLGLTQAELAHRAGITQAALSQIESGHVSPRLDTLRRLAAALGHRLELVGPRDCV